MTQLLGTVASRMSNCMDPEVLYSLLNMYSSGFLRNLFPWEILRS